MTEYPPDCTLRVKPHDSFESVLKYRDGYRVLLPVSLISQFWGILKNRYGFNHESATINYSCTSSNHPARQRCFEHILFTSPHFSASITGNSQIDRTEMFKEMRSYEQATGVNWQNRIREMAARRLEEHGYTDRAIGVLETILAQMRMVDAIVAIGADANGFGRSYRNSFAVRLMLNDGRNIGIGVNFCSFHGDYQRKH